MNKKLEPSGVVINPADSVESQNASDKMEANQNDTGSAVTAQAVPVASDGDLSPQTKCLVAGQGVKSTNVWWLNEPEVNAMMNSKGNIENFNKVQALVAEGKLQEANEVKKELVFTMPMARPKKLVEGISLVRRKEFFVWNNVVLLDYDSHSREKSMALVRAIRKGRRGETLSGIALVSFIEMKFSPRGGLHLLVKSIKGLTLKGSIAFYEWLFRNTMEQEEYEALVNDKGVLFDTAIDNYTKLCLEGPGSEVISFNLDLYGCWNLKPDESFGAIAEEFCQENYTKWAYFTRPDEVFEHFDRSEKRCSEFIEHPPVTSCEGEKNLIKRTIDEVIVPGHIDITKTEKAWFELCNVLFNVLGEAEGRAYFHKLSQFYPGYSRSECDAKFSQVARKGGYHYTYDTFVYHCEKHGINLNNKNYGEE
ncbi:MAG: hypothetical protein IJT97_00355 [Bacteroidaceae bacterium]|nr:hypothetical protein [Bacteroidaceae bacterium]